MQGQVLDSIDAGRGKLSAGDSEFDFGPWQCECGAYFWASEDGGGEGEAAASQKKFKRVTATTDSLLLIVKLDSHYHSCRTINLHQQALQISVARHGSELQTSTSSHLQHAITLRSVIPTPTSITRCSSSVFHLPHLRARTSNLLSTPLHCRLQHPVMTSTTAWKLPARISVHRSRTPPSR